jgi:hypothetical protein
MRKSLAAAAGAVVSAALAGAVFTSPSATAATCRQAVTVSVAPAKIIGWDRSAGVVRLKCRVGGGGATVRLWHSAKLLTMASLVHVPGGGTTARFSVRAVAGVSAPATTVIRASLGRLISSAHVTLQPFPRPSSLTLSRTSFGPSGSATGTVTLSGEAPNDGLLVYLSFDGTGAVSFPATVTVRPRHRTVSFAVSASAPHMATSGQLRAVLGIGGSPAVVSPRFQVTLPEPGVASLGPTDGQTTFVRPGHTLTATVGLYGPAPASGTVVGLSSSSSYAIVPKTVTIAPGATSATFPITALDQPSRSLGAAVSASAYGVGTSFGVRVLPSGNLQSVAAVDGFAEPGTSLRVVLWLSYAQPTDTVVALSSSDPDVTVPATVTIPAGRTGLVIRPAVAASLSQDKRVTVTATLGTETLRSRPFTVGPNGPASVRAPQTMSINGQWLGTVALYAHPAADGAITLSSSDPHVIVPQTTPIHTTEWQSDFQILTTGTLTSPITVTITATYNGLSLSTQVTVTPVPGVTIRWDRNVAGNKRASAARTARSAQSGLGRAT